MFAEAMDAMSELSVTIDQYKMQPAAARQSRIADHATKQNRNRRLN